MRPFPPAALLLLGASPFSAFASPASDHQIENAARSSYNYRAVLEDHVKVRAHDGVVTLTGTVEDQDQKALATDTVENLAGVSGVNNEITVQPSFPENSDAWITLKVRGQLLVKANVSSDDTHVIVKDGHAILWGRSDSLAQKELTAAYTREIAGVKTVKNELVVDTPIPAKTMSRTESIDDASVTSQVRFALLNHRSTRALTPRIVTTNGVVHVTGDASSAAEKSLVTKLASDVRGTKSVTNEMTVKS